MFLLIDIGGTKIRIARSQNLKSFSDPIIIPTITSDFVKGFNLMKTEIKKIVGHGSVKAVICGLPGSLDKNKTKIRRSRNMGTWVGEPIAKMIQQIVKAQVFLKNDADLVGLGEANFGAGRGQRQVVFLSISTGVGGAKLVDGTLDPNLSRFEPGRQIIDAGRSLCKDSNYPYDLESYVGGAEIEKRTGKKPADIDDIGFWQDIAKYLAYALNNIIYQCSPDIIVLGGSVMVNKIPLKEVKKYLSEILTSKGQIPKVVKAKLGDRGGLFGAMQYAKVIYKLGFK